MDYAFEKKWSNSYDDERPVLQRVNKCSQSWKSLIVGGTEADEGEFPHMALLGRNDETWFCAGSLISENFVLTAAHCVVK